MPTQINLNSRVRLESDVLFQELQGEAVLLNLKTGIYLGLNQVGTRIWQLIERDGALRQVLAAMVQEYDAPQEQIERDLLDLVGQMEQQGLVSEVK